MLPRGLLKPPYAKSTFALCPAGVMTQTLSSLSVIHLLQASSLIKFYKYMPGSILPTSGPDGLPMLYPFLHKSVGSASTRMTRYSLDKGFG